MKAMYYEAFGATPEIRTLPDPTPTPGGVVIKVEATGLCRSDWHGWMGHDPDIRLPHVPGHELAGTVLATGRSVGRFKVGDRVTVPFVSLRPLRGMPLGQPAGLRAPVPAGLHGLGLVCRIRGARTCGPQPGRAAGEPR